MVAVVDHHAERGIVIRAATPARTRSAVSKPHFRAGARQFDRCRKPGQPCTNDESLAHRVSMSLANVNSNASLLVRTRLRGAAQPRACIVVSTRE